MIDDEARIEKELQKRELNAPRLTPELIDSIIVGETFTVLPSGKCLICELTLVNGFTVRGESACVSKENFNLEIGKDISRTDARNKVWGFEGYLLQQNIHNKCIPVVVDGVEFSVASGVADLLRELSRD
jgi:hypothetical protein